MNGNRESRIQNQGGRTRTTSFMQLDVWKKAHQVTLEVYRFTRGFPAEERYELVRQMRTAAVSVPANIAEGYGRRKAPDKARMYNIGEGSNEELRYFVILARDLGFLKDWEPLWDAIEEISRMLRRLVERTLEGP